MSDLFRPQATSAWRRGPLRTPPISGTQQTLAGSTAIWDAIWATSNELLEGAAEHTRRAIIILTDGEDTISQVRMQEAINRALKAEA